MKLPLLIFIIYINYSISQDTEGSKKVIVKTIPKKVKPGFYHYYKSGKYVKSVAPDKPSLPDKKTYTAFPKIYAQSNSGQKPVQINVPGSPYFPLENVPEQKVRVKKVLHDFSSPSFRRKRSADDIELAKKKTKSEPSLLNTKNDGLAKNLRAASAKKRKISGSAKKKRELGQLVKSRDKKHSDHHKRSSHHHKHHRPGRVRKIKRNLNSRGKKSPRHGDHSNKLKLPGELSHSAKKKLLAHGQKHEPQEGSSKNTGQRSRKVNGRRLIAGRDALIEDYPYVVSIHKEYNEHWCSGALLNPRLVITTANCLWKSNRLSRMRVRAGSRHPDRGGQVAKIEEVMKHPEWKLRRNPDNDVALVLLDKYIRFSHTVHGVDLPNRVMMPAFDDAWITSYGSDRRDGIYDTKGMSLKVYHARLMEREECNNITQRFGVTVTDNFICLAQSGKRAPCTRDTGAPAVSDGVLWGLASWGIRKLCGTERFPAMFSYVASQSNMDFILNATHLLMADERYYPFPDKFPRQPVSLNTPEPVTLSY